MVNGDSQESRDIPRGSRPCGGVWGCCWPPAEARFAGRTLYIQGDRKLDFLGWVHAIQKAAGSSGDTLSEQQLTEADVPLLVDRCIDYITQCGMCHHWMLVEIRVWHLGCAHQCDRAG